LELQRIKLKNEPKLDTKLEAFPYQIEALKSIQDLNYAAVFYEQGLGKSKIAFDLILFWLEKKAIDTILYVTKKTLLHNIEREFELHTYLKPKILTQNHNANYFVFNSPSRLILTHFELFKSEFERLKLFLQARSVAVILDESTKIKNPDSSIAKAAFELAPLFKKRIIMTGTPVANRPYDIWSQIYFLDQGKSLGDNFHEFKNVADLKYDLSTNTEAKQQFEEFIADIFNKISSFTVRRTKDSGIIQLPEKEFKTVNTHWEPHQYELYRQIRDELRAVVIKEGKPVEDNSEEILKRLVRLVQVASNPHLIDQGYTFIPGKYEYLFDLITQISSQNEKCIVWTSFIGNADWLWGRMSIVDTKPLHDASNPALYLCKNVAGDKYPNPS
jgi:SNF2 family DNA or RNA helicase